MADKGSVGTFEYTLHERVLVLRMVQPSQIVMLERYVDSLRAKGDKMMDASDVDGIISISKKISDATWTTIESLFTAPEDLEWVQMQIIAGKLTEKDLLPLLSNGVTRSPAPDDDAEPVAIKRPGRKTSAAKAAKKTPMRRAKP